MEKKNAKRNIVEWHTREICTLHVTTGNKSNNIAAARTSNVGFVNGTIKYGSDGLDAFFSQNKFFISFSSVTVPHCEVCV